MEAPTTRRRARQRRRPPSRRPGRTLLRRGRQAPTREAEAPRRAGSSPVRDRSSGKSLRALGGALEERGHRGERDVILDAGIDELTPVLGRRAGCAALGRSRATHYRHRRPPLLGPPEPRPRSHRALQPAEAAAILETLNSERFCDQAPAQRSEEHTSELQALMRQQYAVYC